MAESLARDRLYPSLLDRLTDEEPDKRAEARDNRAFTLARLRESVLRDLNWLFNAIRMSEDLSDYPLVQRSVVNYGLPGLSGRPASGLDFADVTRSLRQALLDFEPRLIPHTVRVSAISSKKDSPHNVVSFRIEGQMWSLPVPLEIFLRTDMDLENGQTHVLETDAG